MKNKTFTVVIITVLIVIFAIFVAYTFFNKANKSDKEKCLEVGGTWQKIGSRPVEQCFLLSSDSGKICNDSEQCEGSCLLSQEEYIGNCSYFYDGCEKCEENGGKCISGSNAQGTYDHCDINISTGDGGKPCKDNNDCNNNCKPCEEGCYGKCSDVNIVVGCRNFVEDGRLRGVCYE